MNKISRREMLRKTGDVAAGVLGTALLTTILGPLAHVYVRDRYTTENSIEEVRNARERIKRRHQVEVTVDVPRTFRDLGGETIVSPGDSKYIQMCAILEFEKILNLYPPDTLGKFLRSVTIGEFSGNEMPASGFMTHDGTSVAINLRQMFSSYRSLLSTLINPYALHHEIGHNLTQDYIFCSRNYCEL